MTEEEWAVGTDANAMLWFARQEMADSARAQRQARRFALACAYRLSRHLADPRSIEALRQGERALMVPLMRPGLARAHKLATAAASELYATSAPPDAWRAANIVAEATYEEHWFAATDAAGCLRFQPDHSPRWAADTVRELFGNPFRLTLLPDGWRHFQRGLIVRLARQAHAEKRFDDLPVLADALEDAGCTDTYLLNHLRSADHLPGCWAVELLRDED